MNNIKKLYEIHKKSFLFVAIFAFLLTFSVMAIIVAVTLIQGRDGAYIMKEGLLHIPMGFACGIMTVMFLFLTASMYSDDMKNAVMLGMARKTYILYTHLILLIYGVIMYVTTWLAGFLGNMAALAMGAPIAEIGKELLTEAGVLCVIFPALIAFDVIGLVLGAVIMKWGAKAMGIAYFVFMGIGWVTVPVADYLDAYTKANPQMLVISIAAAIALAVIAVVCGIVFAIRSLRRISI